MRDSGGDHTWSVGTVTSRGSTLVADFSGFCLVDTDNAVEVTTCNSSDATQLWYQP